VGVDFTALPPSNNVQDETPNSHGTHVSGIASGAAISNVFQAFGSSQFASNIKIMPLKVVHQDQQVDIQAIENALQFAEKFQARIVSASWNTKKDVNLESQMLNEHGTLFVLAAGNGIPRAEGFQGLDLETNQIFPPAFDLDNAITVGALAANGSPAEFSNFGIKSVQIFAPGCAVTSTLAGNRFGRETGTSQATPFVSLTAALIWAQEPDLPPISVKNRILQTADPGKESLTKSLWESERRQGSLGLRRYGGDHGWNLQLRTSA
jgi:subtilisin family serine protease